VNREQALGTGNTGVGEVVVEEVGVCAALDATATNDSVAVKKELFIKSSEVQGIL
jgi:hypothetical protein